MQDKSGAFSKVNTMNFKVLGDSISGTFDHDAVVFSRELFASTGADDAPQWVYSLIHGEDLRLNVSERAAPSLGGLFTPAGQKALHEEIVDTLAQDLGGNDKAGGMLDPEALDVRLAFIEEKSKQATRGGSGSLATTLADNRGAEKASMRTGLAAALAAGNVLTFDASLSQVPNKPGSVGLLTAAKRSAKGIGRGDNETQAQQLRQLAQSAASGADFYANLDKNLKALEKMAKAGADRRVESAIFHVNLHQFVLAAGAKRKAYMSVFDVMCEAWSLPQHACNSLQSAAGTIGNQAGALMDQYRQVADPYQTPLRGKEDKEQQQRLTGVLQELNYPLAGLGQQARQLARASKKTN